MMANADSAEEIQKLEQQIALLKAKEEAFKHSARLLEAFNQASSTMSFATTPEEIFETVAEKLKELGISSIIYSVDPNLENLTVTSVKLNSKVLKAAEKLVGLEALGFTIPIDQVDAFRISIREQRTHLSHDFKDMLHQLLPGHLKKFSRKTAQLLNVPLSINAPLISGNNIIGLLSIQSDELIEEDIHLVTAFAHQLASSWQKAQLYQQAQHEIGERIQIEKQLVEQHKRSQQYLDIAGVFIVVLNNKGEIVLLNQKGCDVLGYTEDELIGKNWFEQVITDQERERVSDVFQQIIQGDIEPIEYFENSVKTKNGEQRIIAWHNSLLSDASGKISGTLSSGEDITERVQTEQALRASEARFRSIIEDQTEFLVRWQPDGTRTFVNDAYCRYFGLPREELIGQNFLSVVAEDDAHIILEQLKDITPDSPISPYYQHRIHRADGSLGWLQWIDRGIFDQEGNLIELQSVGRDITEQILTENALRDSEERFRSIVDASPLGMHMYHLEPDGRLIFVGSNPAADKILWVDNNHFIGKTIEDAFPALADTEIPDRYRKAAAEGESWQTTQITYEDDRIAGAYDVFAVQTSPGKMIAIFSDVTKQKRALQEQLRLVSILEATSDVVGTATLDGRLIYFNKAGRRIFGLEEDTDLRRISDFKSQPITDFLKIQDENISAALLYGIWSGESIIVDLSNQEIPVSIVLVVHRDSEGEAEFISAIIRDISDLQQAEDLIHLQSTALDAAATGIFIADNKGQIIWANPAISEITGYEPDELIGKKPEIFSSGEHKDEYYQAISDTLSKGTVWRGELINRRKDGRTYISEQTITPVFNSKKQATHYISIQQDVSERKENELALRQRASQLALLNDIGEQIVAVLDLEKIFQLAVKLVQESFGYHHVGIFMVDPQEKMVVMQAKVGGFNELFPENHALEIGQGMVGWVVENNQILLSNDVHNEPRYTNLYPEILPTHSELAVPIYIGEKVIGVLDAQSPNQNAFDDSDVTVMQTLADQIAIAIENARLHEAMRKELIEREQTDAKLQLRANQLAALNQMGQVVSSSLDIDQVLEKVISVVPPLVEADGVSILLKENPEELYFAAASGKGAANLQGQRIPADIGIAGQVLTTGASTIINSSKGQENLYRGIEDISGYHTQSLLAVPLILGKEIIGVMEAVHSQPNAFTNDDLQIIETAGSWASIAIINARQHAATERRLKETQAVATINQALNETLDLHRLLQLMVDSISQIIPHIERVVAHLYNEEDATLIPAAVAGISLEKKPVLQMQSGQGIAGEVIKTGLPINVRNTQEDERFIPIDGATYLKSLLVVPVQSADRRLGTISVSSTVPKAFTDEDEHLLTMVGVQAALAIESARIFEETQQRAQHLTLLNEITQTALKQPDLQTILLTLVESIQKAFGSDECSISLWDDEQEVLIQSAAVGQTGDNFETVIAELDGANLTKAVLKSGQALIIEDAHSSEHINEGITEQYADRFVLALPLIAGEQGLGAVIISFLSPHNFTAQEINLGESIAQQTALAISKAKLLEAEQNRREEAETLRDITAALTSTLEVDQVLDRLLLRLKEAIPYDSAAVLLVEEDALQIVASKGLDDFNIVLGQKIPAAAPVFQEIFATKRPVVIPDVLEDASWNDLDTGVPIRSWMGIPLIIQENVIGYLTMDNWEPGTFSEQHLSLAQAFGNQTSIALQNARLYAATNRRLAESNILFFISNLIIASAVPDVEAILHQIVDQLRSDFGYYHVHVYLIDQESRTLIANQGSGTIGAQLKEEGYHFTSEEGIVGYAASVGEAFMTNNVSEVLFFMPNPLLPRNQR